MLGTMKREAHPISRNSQPCWFWLGVEGSCPDGELCKFSHEDQQWDRIELSPIQANQNPVKRAELKSCRFCSSSTCNGGIKCLLSSGEVADTTVPKAIPDETYRLELVTKKLSTGDSPIPSNRLTEEQQRRLIEKRKIKEAENQRLREEQQRRILEERKNKEAENRRLRELFEQEKRRKAEEQRQHEQEEWLRKEQEKKRREEAKMRKEQERQKREEEWRKKEEERQAEAKRKKEVREIERERAIQAAKEAKWREEAKVTQQFAVGESSLITCAAGLDIRQLIAGFELCRIRIKKLPLATKEEDLSTLFVQHGQIAGEFFVSEIKRPRLTNKLEAIALVRGQAIAHGLDGIMFHGEVLTVELCKTVSGLASNNTPFLTVSWVGARVKTATLLATYPSRADAETWAARIDGTYWNGFKLRTALNSSKHSFEVTLSHCPPGSALKLPNQEMAGTMNVRAIAPIVETQEATLLGVVHDHILCQTGARGDTYRVTLPNVDNGETKVTIDFDTWENLRLAYASVHQQRLAYADGNLSPILQARQSEPHHYSCLISIRQYTAQQQQWNALSEKVPGRDAWVHVQAADKPDLMLVRILGEDERAAGALKVRAEGLVGGETMDATQWHSSFLTLAGRRFFDRVYNETKVHVRSDFDTRTLKVFGEAEAIAAARTMIREEVEHKTAEEMVWTLDRQAVGFFVRVGLGRLKELIGEDNVDLQLAYRPARITIKGGEVARHHLRRLLEESRATADVLVGGGGGDGGLCPVCYTEPTSPEQLGCGHTYCAGCLQHFLTSAVETKTFPLLCTGNEAKCSTPISLPFMRRFLSIRTFEHLVDVAFACYLERHPQELKYCTTPDCKQVYRHQQPPQNIRCPSCLKTICSACDDEPHENMSCEESRIYRNPEERDRRNEEFMAQNGYKKCSRCSRWIEKIEGCNRMECRCGAHLCWRCNPALAFNTAAEAYSHLNSSHGGPY